MVSTLAPRGGERTVQSCMFHSFGRVANNLTKGTAALCGILLVHHYNGQLKLIDARYECPRKGAALRVGHIIQVD